jgi:hypothetical protein
MEVVLVVEEVLVALEAVVQVVVVQAVAGSFFVFATS